MFFRSPLGSIVWGLLGVVRGVGLRVYEVSMGFRTKRSSFMGPSFAVFPIDSVKPKVDAGEAKGGCRGKARMLISFNTGGVLVQVHLFGVRGIVTVGIRRVS